MGLTSRTKKILIPAILYLSGYVCALQFNLSVTLDPVLTVALEEIPPPFCTFNASHSALINFFDVVDQIGALIDNGELSEEGFFEELGSSLDPHIRVNLVKLGDHPKFARIRDSMNRTDPPIVIVTDWVTLGFLLLFILMASLFCATLLLDHCRLNGGAHGVGPQDNPLPPPIEVAVGG